MRCAGVDRLLVGLKDERDQLVCTWMDSGGHYDHEGLASAASASPPQRGGVRNASVL